MHYKMYGTGNTNSSRKIMDFIGILYIRGAYEQNKKLTHLIYGIPNGVFHIFRMSWAEIASWKFYDFCVLIKKKKKTSGVKIWGKINFLLWRVRNTFIENSENCYKPASNITVDGLQTKVICRFTQYMPKSQINFT